MTNQKKAPISVCRVMEKATALLLALTAASAVLNGCTTSVPTEDTTAAVQETTRIEETVLPEKEPRVLESPSTVICGELVQKNDSVLARGETLALYDFDLPNGSFSTVTKSPVYRTCGVVFGYTEQNGSSSYYRFLSRDEAKESVLEKVENGVATELKKFHHTKGHNYAEDNLFTVTKEGSTVYCYYFDMTLFSCDNVPEGKFGWYTSDGNVRFYEPTLVENRRHQTADTLIFGHSYMDLWYTWEEDLAGVSLGTAENIGVGGTLTSDWEEWTESVISYRPSLGICCLGINDIISPHSAPIYIATVLERTLNGIKKELPEFRVILFNVNRCISTNGKEETVSELNALYDDLAARYEWISVVDMETAFCDENGVCQSDWFLDGLHPTQQGYLVFVQRLKETLKGKNQPEAKTNEISLASAKEQKINSLNSVKPIAFPPSARNTAQQLYDAALAQIEACRTVQEVENLDFGDTESRLRALESYAQDISRQLCNGTLCGKSDETFAMTVLGGDEASGAFRLTGNGYRIASDSEFGNYGVCVSINAQAAEENKGGLLLRAEQNEDGSVSGYLLRFDAASDLLTLWALDHAYGDAGEGTQHQLGSWKYGGEIEGSEFFVTISGCTVKICRLSDYLTYGEDCYGFSLSWNIWEHAEHENGRIGILSYGEGAFDLTLSDFTPLSTETK